MSDRSHEVLVVEDHPTDRELIRRILLKSNGQFTVTTAARLDEALDALRKQRFDVVILDLGLPDCVGLETIDRVMEVADDVPIIVLSAMDAESVGFTAVQKGAQDYWVKGTFDAHLLVRSIRYAIERQDLLSKLKDSEERYALAIAGVNDGLWDWDLATDRIFYSPRWKRMLGYDEAAISDDPSEWLDRVHAEDRTRLQSEFSLHINGVTSHMETEYRVLHKDSTYRWMLCRGLAVRDADGRAYRMAGSQSDITRRKLAEARLTFDAHHDRLTQLPNRAYFLDRLGSMIELGKRRSDRSFALLFVDCDRFKIVNDSLGHDVGDELLVAVAGRLKESVRPEDMVARLGGDEFAVLLDQIDAPIDALRISDRIHERMGAPFVIQGNELIKSASVGIALSDAGYQLPEDMLRDADIAMYRAKTAGNGRTAIFDVEMHERAVQSLRLEADLRSAYQNHHLALYYQPIIHLESDRLAGFEALIRWHHPTQGTIMPSEFIPVAEESGLIVPIGEWVLQRACRDMMDLQRRNPETKLAINVNLSARQIMEGNLIETISRVLEATGYEPIRLVLRVEFTESMLIEQSGTVTETLLALKDLGIQLCIDDFGTGYSSLSYIQRFPIDIIKIDKSFIDRLGFGNENTEIVRTIVALAHSVGVDVIAEGIEAENQRERLLEMGCEYGQGYLFAKALPLDRLTQIRVLDDQPLRDR